MRKVEIKRGGKGFYIYIGEVDQSGNYELLELTEAEAALVFMKLKMLLNQ